MSIDDKIALDNVVIEVPEVIGVLMVNIINLNNDKVDKVAGKTLSTNDYTTDEKTKLSKIEIEANKYVHPAYTAKSLGLYKFTVDSTGHVNSTSAITKADITALGIPSTNTTYNLVTETTTGIMASSDKVKLNGIESGAQVNVEEIFDVADYLIDSNGEAVSTVSQETYNLIYQAVLDKKQLVRKLKQAMGGIG